MIITKTPLRISFAGGGTDLAAFYERRAGAVVSFSVDLYIYLAIHRFFEDRIVLKYSKTEEVENVCDIAHPLIRECLDICGCNEPIELTSFADIPSKGSGLGSSSAFAVGLAKAVHAYMGKNISKERCAEIACEIEIDRLGEPIGKQDQYGAAMGGINYIKFNQDGSVHVDPIIIDRDGRDFLEDHFLMFYTGITRSASGILEEQQKNTTDDEEKFNNLSKMRDLADELRDELMEGNLESIGTVMHKGWELKRGLASKISSGNIDELYQKAMDAGATGGKLLGAGGGGFFLFFVPPYKQKKVIAAMDGLRLLRPRFDMQGTRVIYIDD